MPEPNAPAQGLEGKLGIFDSIGSSLESLVGGVKAIPKAAKKAAYYTYYTAKAAAGLGAGLALAGTPTALILPGGMVAGSLLANLKNKEKKTFKETYKQLANEAAIGGLLGAALHYTFGGAQHVGNIVKNAYGTAAALVTKGVLGVAHLFPFLGLHEYLNRLFISEYEPKPLKDIPKKLKGPLKWLIPPVVANFTYVPDYLSTAYQMPIAAGISTGYGLLKTEKKKEEEAPEATPSPATQAYEAPKPT